MNFKEQLNADMDVFYNISEFSDTALYNGIDIAINKIDDIEIESIDTKSYTCQSSDVVSLATGDTFVILGKDYKVVNFEHQNDGLETILILGEK